MVDAGTFTGLNKVFSDVTIRIADTTKHILAEDLKVAYKYLPFSLPSTLDDRVAELRAKYHEAVHGYALRKHVQTHYGASYLSRHKLPPKTVFQLIIQIALRHHFGYNPFRSMWSITDTCNAAELTYLASRRQKSQSSAVRLKIRVFHLQNGEGCF